MNKKYDKQRLPAGLLCAVDEECRLLMSTLRKTGTERIGNVYFMKGSIDGKPVVIVRTGIGKVNAAHAATLLAERFRPSCLISFGIGGAYPGTGCGIGDVIVAEREYYADEGVGNKDGFRDMRETGIPVLRKGSKAYYNEWPTDAKLLKKFRKIKHTFPFKVCYGRFLTVSTVTGTMRKGRLMRDSFQGICENMEGAAIFQIARIYGIPSFEMRGVSNIVEDRDRKKWDIPVAANSVQYALRTFLREL